MVLRLLRISRPTLAKYVKEGRIKTTTLENGRYEYNDEDVYKIVNNNLNRFTYAYCRVATNEQVQEIKEQEDSIRQYCLSSGIAIDKMISEVAAPADKDRDKFLALIEEMALGKVGTLVVYNKYRLGRESVPIIETLCKAQSIRLIYVDSSTESLWDKAEANPEVYAYAKLYAIESLK